jgi:hypothetical protein
MWFKLPSSLKHDLDFREFGPFRVYWTIPFEGYNKVLKALFRMTNWKGAPHFVARHWATKSVMHYRDPSRRSWYTDTVESVDEYTTSFDQRSFAVRALMQSSQPPYAVRMLTTVIRDRLKVFPGAWVLVQSESTKVDLVGCIQELVQAAYTTPAESYIRMWCTGVKEVNRQSDGSYAAPAATKPRAMLVYFERVRVQHLIHPQVLTDTDPEIYVIA